jgi:hypothetical protein
MILDARFVNHTPKPSLTVSWRIVGKQEVIGIWDVHQISVDPRSLYSR